MAQDEGRFGRISNLCNCWAPLGIRPTVPNQIVREYVYAYSAVAPSIGRIYSLILPYSNTENMNIFLESLSQEFKDYYIIMQMDKAGWHKSNNLKVPENIKIIYQPAYSPELNPTEHVWDYLREKLFNNRLFKSLNEVINTLCIGLKSLSIDTETIKSMTNFPHLNITF